MSTDTKHVVERLRVVIPGTALLHDTIAEIDCLNAEIVVMTASIREKNAEIDRLTEVAKIADIQSEQISQLTMQIERLRVDAERWRTFWSAINGERVTLWTVVGGGPRESVFMIPDLVLEKIDAAIREGKTK